jgi:hypothetical protein
MVDSKEIHNLCTNNSIVYLHGLLSPVTLYVPNSAYIYQNYSQVFTSSAPNFLYEICKTKYTFIKPQYISFRYH